MRTFYICIFLIALNLTLLVRLSAQTYHLQESSRTLKGAKARHEILPRPDGDILTITHPNAGDKGPMTICRFDSRLNEVYSRKITLLSHECYQAAWYDGNQLYLLCTDKHGGLTRYSIDDRFGALTGQPLPLTGLLDPADAPKAAAWQAGSSPDGDFHYIVATATEKKGSRKTLRGIILNRQGEKTTLFSYPLPTTARTSDISFVQSANGALSIVYSSTPCLFHPAAAQTGTPTPEPTITPTSTVTPAAATASTTHESTTTPQPITPTSPTSPESVTAAKPTTTQATAPPYLLVSKQTFSKTTPPTPQYTIVRISLDGSTTALPLTGLPEGDFRYVSWVVDGQTLRFSGLMSRLKKANFTSIITGSVDPATGSVFDLRQTEVAALMAQATPLLRGLTQNGLPANLTLLRTMPMGDGSRVVLFESSGQRLVQNRFSPAMQNPVSAFGRPGAFTSLSPSTQGTSYYSRGDVYVLRLDRNNSPQWLDVVSKNQEESDKVTAIGIGCLLDRQNDLHLFFYDSKCNLDAYAANPTPLHANDPRSCKFACITITPEGAMKKQFIEVADNRYRLMPEIAFVGANNEACFLAADHADYKLGIIDVK